MKRFKIVNAMFLAVVCVLLLPLCAKASAYSDVYADTPYESEIRYVTEHGLFSGVGNGCFLPDGTLTRGMFVTVLGRTAGADAAGYSSKNTFTDVASDRYYTGYVAWANTKGFVLGYGGGVFGPDDPVTCAQMRLVARRFAAYYNLDLVVTPYEGEDRPATRAEAAAMIADLHRSFTTATVNVAVSGEIAPVRIAPGYAISGILLDGGVLPD